MDALEAIYTRRSIRRYSSREVEESKLLRILEACRWAPSARNLQPWELVVIKEKNTLMKVAKKAPYGHFIADAPLAIAIITNPESKWHIIDGSLLTENLMIAAWALGLGTCWIGSMDREEVKKILRIPHNRHLLTVIPVGYPAEIPKSSRKPLREFVYLDEYGNYMFP